MQKTEKCLTHGYSSESTLPELSYEYQRDRVCMIFRNLCILVLWTKVALALEGLKCNKKLQTTKLFKFT